MSALFNFQSFLTVVLLVICTCTYVKIHFPTVLDRKTGFRGFFWKAARIGMRDPLTEEPPPSRFDPEELNLFEPFETVDLTPPSITWVPSVDDKLRSGKLRPQLLIVALSKVGISLVHNLAGKTVIGNILLAGSSLPKTPSEASAKEKTCYLLAFDPQLSIIVVSVQYLVPAEIANLWTKLLFQNVEADRVVVLEKTPIRHFRGKLSLDEPSLFVLKTDKQKAQDKNATVIPYYPSGSLVDGLAAALLTHCQIRRMKGQLILTWPEHDTTLVKNLVTALSDIVKGLPDGIEISFEEAAKNLRSKKSLIRNDLYI